MIPEDFIIEPIFSHISYEIDFVSLTGRTLEDVFFDGLYIDDQILTALSPDLIWKLKDMNHLKLKLGKHTSAKELMSNQFFFSE
jgi:hypothetical protein